MRLRGRGCLLRSRNNCESVVGDGIEERLLATFYLPGLIWRWYGGLEVTTRVERNRRPGPGKTIITRQIRAVRGEAGGPLIDSPGYKQNRTKAYGQPGVTVETGPDGTWHPKFTYPPCILTTLISLYYLSFLSFL